MKQYLLIQKLNDKKKEMEAQERSHRESIAQLKEKFMKEKENLLRAKEEVLEHRLKVQQELLNVDFQKKSNELHIEITRLRQATERNQNTCLLL